MREDDISIVLRPCSHCGGAIPREGGAVIRWDESAALVGRAFVCEACLAAWRAGEWSPQVTPS